MVVVFGVWMITNLFNVIFYVLVKVQYISKVFVAQLKAPKLEFIFRSTH